MAVDVAEFATALDFITEPDSNDADALRITDAAGRRLLAVAQAEVIRYLSGGEATETIETEAGIRVAAYLRGAGGAAGAVASIEAGSVNIKPRIPGNALRRSGAMALALLSPYRVRRALGADEDE